MPTGPGADERSDVHGSPTKPAAPQTGAKPGERPRRAPLFGAQAPDVPQRAPGLTVQSSEPARGVGRPPGWSMDRKLPASSAGSGRDPASAGAATPAARPTPAGTPDRLARLTAQRQRLAEQRARLAAGKAAPIGGAGSKAVADGPSTATGNAAPFGGTGRKVAAEGPSTGLPTFAAAIKAPEDAPVEGAGSKLTADGPSTALPGSAAFVKASVIGQGPATSRSASGRLSPAESLDPVISKGLEPVAAKVAMHKAAALPAPKQTAVRPVQTSHAPAHTTPALLAGSQSFASSALPVQDSIATDTEGRQTTAEATPPSSALSTAAKESRAAITEGRQTPAGATPPTSALSISAANPATGNAANGVLPEAHQVHGVSNGYAAQTAATSTGQSNSQAGSAFADAAVPKPPAAGLRSPRGEQSLRPTIPFAPPAGSPGDENLFGGESSPNESAKEQATDKAAHSRGSEDFSGGGLNPDESPKEQAFDSAAHLPSAPPEEHAASSAPKSAVAFIPFGRSESQHSLAQSFHGPFSGQEDESSAFFDSPEAGQTPVASQPMLASAPQIQAAPQSQRHGNPGGYGGYGTSTATQWGSHSSLSSSQWEAPSTSQPQAIMSQTYSSQWEAPVMSQPQAVTSQTYSSQWEAPVMSQPQASTSQTYSSQWEAPLTSQPQAITSQAYAAQAPLQPAASGAPPPTGSLPSFQPQSQWGQPPEQPAATGFWQPSAPTHQETIPPASQLSDGGFWQPTADTAQAASSTYATTQPPSTGFWQPSTQAGLQGAPAHAGADYGHAGAQGAREAHRQPPTQQGHASSKSWTGNDSATGSQWEPVRGLGTIHSGEPLQDAASRADASGPLTSRTEHPSASQPPAWHLGDDNDGADFFAESPGKVPGVGNPEPGVSHRAAAAADQPLSGEGILEVAQSLNASLADLPQDQLAERSQSQQVAEVPGEQRHLSEVEAPASSSAEQWATPFAAPASQAAWEANPPKTFGMISEPAASIAADASWSAQSAGWGTGAAAYTQPSWAGDQTGCGSEYTGLQQGALDSAWSYDNHGYQQAASAAPSSVQWQTPTASQPAFLMPPGSQHPQQPAWGYSAAQQIPPPSSAAPRTAEEAIQSPSGRPPIPVIAFGFGGRVVLMQPRPAPVLPSGGQAPLAQGPLQLLRMGTLSASLAHSRQQGAQLQDGTMDHTAELLQKFPGPLTASSSRDKVLAYIAEREQSAAEEAGDSGALRLLWGVLRLLVIHRGSLRPAQQQPGKTKSQQLPAAEAHLAELLVPASDSAAASSELSWAGQSEAASTPILAPGQGVLGDQEAAARHLQGLLQKGQRTEALKVAMEAGMWGPAMLLAHSCGEAAFRETASAMAAAFALPGAPLHTLLSMLSGKGASVFAPSSTPSAAGEGSIPAQNQQAGQQGSAAALADWKGNLAILAANSAPGDVAAITDLGNQLWSVTHNAVAAHVCYLVAGLAPQPCDATARLCLPGGDHRSQPRTFASTSAIQRALILEWARLAGNPAVAPHVAAFLPYKLVLASRLAEYGFIEAASQHCIAVTTSLNALGKLPGGLLLTRSLTNELQTRLQVHASAFHIQIAHGAGGSLMSKAGRWLDRGLSKLIGVSDLPEGAVTPDSVAKPPTGVPLSRRASSQPGSPKQRAHRRVNSAVEMLGPGVSRPATPAVAQPPVSGSRPPTAPATTAAEASSEGSGALSVRGILGKVGSFTSLLGASSSGPNKKEAMLGEENKMYFDTELKIWRVEGAPPPAPEAALPPPPTSFPASAVPGNEGAGPSKPAVPAGPPSAGGGPPGAPNANRFVAAPGGVRSRYVDTLGGTSGQQAALPPIPQASSIVPRPQAFFTPGGSGATRPSAGGGFFVPPPPAVPSTGSSSLPPLLEASAPELSSSSAPYGWTKSAPSDLQKVPPVIPGSIPGGNSADSGRDSGRHPIGMPAHLADAWGSTPTESSDLFTSYPALGEPGSGMQAQGFDSAVAGSAYGGTANPSMYESTPPVLDVQQEEMTELEL